MDLDRITYSIEGESLQTLAGCLADGGLGNGLVRAL